MNTGHFRTLRATAARLALLVFMLALGVFKATIAQAQTTTFNFGFYPIQPSLTAVGAAAQEIANQWRLVPAQPGQIGGLWLTAPATLLPNFTTRFQVGALRPEGAQWGSEGFSFIIQNQGPAPIGGGGDGLGYAGLLPALAIEFDYVGDATIPGPHVAVMYRGPNLPFTSGSESVLAWAPLPTTFFTNTVPKAFVSTTAAASFRSTWGTTLLLTLPCEWI